MPCLYEFYGVNGICTNCPFHLEVAFHRCVNIMQAETGICTKVFLFVDIRFFYYTDSIFI